MIILLYFSELNKVFNNTATFSDGGLRYGWKPPSQFFYQLVTGQLCLKLQFK